MTKLYETNKLYVGNLLFCPNEFEFYKDENGAITECSYIFEKVDEFKYMEIFSGLVFETGREGIIQKANSTYIENIETFDAYFPEYHNQALPDIKLLLCLHYITTQKEQKRGPQKILRP